MLCLVGWKSYWRSVLHKPPPHGCGTDTPARTHPIYSAAVHDYQTTCVSIQSSGSTFACGESFYFSWGTPIKCIHVNSWNWRLSLMDYGCSHIKRCFRSGPFAWRSSHLDWVILRGRCVHMPIPSCLNVLHAIILWIICPAERSGGVSDMFFPCWNGVK